MAQPCRKLLRHFKPRLIGIGLEPIVGWPLSLCRKFKNSIDPVNCLLDVLFGQRHVLRKIWLAATCWVFIICFPCLSEETKLLTLEEKPKLIDCYMMFFKRPLKQITTFGQHETALSLQSRQFWCECLSELQPRELFGFMTRTSNREVMINKSSEQCTCQAEATGDKGEFIRRKIHYYLFAFLGGMIGIALGILIIFIFHRTFIFMRILYFDKRLFFLRKIVNKFGLKTAKRKHIIPYNNRYLLICRIC
jgi:hypothetical protein